MPVLEDGKWRIWVAGAVFVIVVGFALRRYQSTFGPQFPDWMHLREHESERIPEMHGINSAWRQFAELLRLTRAAAAAQHVANYTILLTELSGDEHDATLWWGEPIPNQGFEPMPRVERELWMESSRLIGYYTDEGTPLGFATRKNAHGGNQLLITVHLDKPIAPAASMFLIRRERRSDLRPATSGNERLFGLGYLRYDPDTIETRGLLLPPHATLVRYLPQAPAVVIPVPPIMVAWISADLITNTTPLSITFAPR